MKICTHGWRVVGLVGVALSGLTLHCAQPLQPPAQSVRDVRVSGLRAEYDGVRANLSWSASGGQFSFYRVYRTWITDASGKPDRTTLTSTGAGRIIAEDMQTFGDLPEPAEGVYFYGVCAVVVRGNDTIECSLSPLVSVQIGTGVRFSINNGDVMAKSSLCSLWVEDPLRRVSWIRFTQITSDSIDTNGTLVPFSPQSLVDPGDQELQVEDLWLAGYIQTSQTSLSSKIKRLISVPVFGITDSLNPDYQDYLSPGGGRASTFTWRLPAGRGQKKVFAELTYTDDSRDTIADIIQTNPLRIEVAFRNKNGNGWEGATKKDTIESMNPGSTDSCKVSIFYSPTIQFSVKIFGDSTIDTGFECWMVVDGRPASTSRVTPQSLGDPTFRWLMTTPRRYQLTGKGDEHSSEAVYEYSLDTNRQDGRENLTFLRQGSAARVTAALTGSPTEVLAAFESMSANQMDRFGKKEFFLVFRFCERAFNSRFTMVAGYKGMKQELRTYRDSYIASMKLGILQNGPNHLQEGSIIKGVFSCALDSMHSISDFGLAQIMEVKLIVARMPADFNWADSVARSRLSPEIMYSWRNFTYGFPLIKVSPIINKVRWDDIDPRLWPNGTYVMAVWVRDEFGRSGFARINNTGTPSINPWSVEIRAN